MRLFVYVDEPILSEAMSFLFHRTPDIKLETIINAAEQILPEVLEGRPDLLLLNLTPGLSLEIIARLHQEAPDCRIVLWTRYSSEEFAHRAMELGVRGILPRTCSTELLIKCLRKVHAGELWFDRQLTANHIHCHKVVLTPRQAQLAQMVAEGLKNKQIAEALSISEGAVKVYLSHLFEKIGIKDRMELAQLVARNIQLAEFTAPCTEAAHAKLEALYVTAPDGGTGAHHHPC